MREERPLRFRGPPSSLTAMIVGVESLPTPLPLRLALPGSEDAEFVADVTPDEGRARLYLSLPLATPPGRYKGTAYLDKEARGVVAEVESDPGLDIEPGNVRLTAAAGDRVRLEFTFYNAGNVPVEIRGGYVFGLFPDEGAERAILQSHSSKADGAHRLNVLVDALAEEFAGTVRVKIDHGAGALAPREGRDVGATLTMPKGLVPGRSYDGTWDLEGSSCYVRVDVPQTRIK